MTKRWVLWTIAILLGSISLTASHRNGEAVYETAYHVTNIASESYSDEHQSPVQNIRAQQVCAEETVEFEQSLRTYQIAYENMVVAEREFGPVEEFYEQHAERIGDPSRTLEDVLQTLLIEDLKEELPYLRQLNRLCKAHPASSLLCSIAEACVIANLERAPDDGWDCTHQDLSDQLADTIIPAFEIIYRDEFDQIRANYYTALTEFFAAQDAMESAFQSRLTCLEQAQVYNQVCPSGPVSRLAVGVYGEIVSPLDAGDLNTVAERLPGQPVSITLRTEPTMKSAPVFRHSVSLGTQFLVSSGPACANDVTWWNVSLFEFGSDEIITGWLVEGNSAGYFTRPLIDNTASENPSSTTQQTSSDLRFSCPGQISAPITYLFNEDPTVEDWTDYVTTIADTVCDVNQFWQLNLANDYSAPHYVIHIAPSTDGRRISPDGYGACSREPEPPYWAFYCDVADNPGIVIDRDKTLQDYRIFGSIETIYTLAHEWGHHIQFIEWKTPFSELQAECLVGAYIRYAVDNNGTVKVQVMQSDWETSLAYLETRGDEFVSSDDTQSWQGITLQNVAFARKLGFDSGIEVCRLADFSSLVVEDETVTYSEGSLSDDIFHVRPLSLAENEVIRITEPADSTSADIVEINAIDGFPIFSNGLWILTREGDDLHISIASVFVDNVEQHGTAILTNFFSGYPYEILRVETVGFNFLDGEGRTVENPPQAEPAYTLEGELIMLTLGTGAMSGPGGSRKYVQDYAPDEFLDAFGFLEDRSIDLSNLTIENGQIREAVPPSSSEAKYVVEPINGAFEIRFNYDLPQQDMVLDLATGSERLIVDGNTILGGDNLTTFRTTGSNTGILDVYSDSGNTLCRYSLRRSISNPEDVAMYCEDTPNHRIIIRDFSTGMLGLTDLSDEPFEIVELSVDNLANEVVAADPILSVHNDYGSSYPTLLTFPGHADMEYVTVKGGSLRKLENDYAIMSVDKARYPNYDVIDTDNGYITIAYFGAVEYDVAISLQTMEASNYDDIGTLIETYPIAPIDEFYGDSTIFGRTDGSTVSLNGGTNFVGGGGANRILLSDSLLLHYVVVTDQNPASQLLVGNFQQQNVNHILTGQASPIGAGTYLLELNGNGGEVQYEYDLEYVEGDLIIGRSFGFELTIKEFKNGMFGITGIREAPDYDETRGDLPPLVSNADWIPTEREFAGVMMVLVPEGCFLMGSDNGHTDSQPAHVQCFEQSFWIDKFEVTNLHIGSSGVFEGDNQPRDSINWLDARDYCESRGARLPAEREWEYAARGPDNLLYPWGNDFVVENVVFFRNSSFMTSGVGTRPAGVSWVGAYDMSGNVMEWVSSGYYTYPYDENDGREATDEINARGDLFVARGGSYEDTGDRVQTVYRIGYESAYSHNSLGFRCARDYDG